jgi:hypothetical protein
MTSAYACPAGYFSPPGSQTCFMCQIGFYCDTGSQVALATYEATSSAGYFTKIIQLGTTQLYQSGICPQGYYCPQGAFFPVPCPPGTFNDLTGQSTSAACLVIGTVHPGYYTDKPGMYWAIIQNSNKCAPGYFCTGAAKSAYDQPCPVGTYTATEAQSACVTCPAGYYCLGGANNACTAQNCPYPTLSYWPIICPAGFFCEASVGGAVGSANYFKNFPQPCPKGTYGGSVGLQNINQCTKCDPGSYCAEVGAKAPTGKCDAGFYCVNTVPGTSNIGATNPEPAAQAFPNDNLPVDATIGGPCPVGGYCEAGSFQPKACPGGFYHLRDTTIPYIGLKTIFDCTVCPPGSYCAGTVSATAGQGAPSGYCEAGFFCLAQSTVIDQYPSPPGSYSRPGSSGSTQCEVGTFNIFWHEPDTNPNWPTVYPGSAAASPINLTNQDIFYDPQGVV